jgi:monoamine oxidase
VTDVDLVVVGAGFAGLAAARAAADAGLSVVVLEARERVGGRVYTTHVSVDGVATFVDLGGQWAGPTQDHLLDLVRELALPTFATFTEGKNMLWVRGKRSLYTGMIPWLGPLALLNFGVAQFRLERMAKKVPLDAPWSAPRAAEWDARTLASWLDDAIRIKVTRDLVDAALETVFAAEAKEMSLLHALFYIHSGKDLDVLLGTEGGAQATRVDGGMQTVADALAKKIASKVDLRVSSPVRRIVQDRAGVTAFGASSVRAKRAIVALPPKLAVALAFEPKIGRRAELLAKSPMGAVIKCTAIYDEPFWRAEGLSGMCVSDEGPIHVSFDNSPPSGKPGVLMGFVEAANARKLGKLSEVERRDTALACFARRYGERARKAIAYVDHVWEHDAWTGGCYGAFMPPGVWTSLGPMLREPSDRIHWAGTETATVWSGYIDGAIQSGKRAAEEVVRALRG